MGIDYVFGKAVSSTLSLKRMEFIYSKRTGRVKMVLLDGRLMATIRSDRSIALTVYGASLLATHPVFRENCLVVEDGVDQFVARGRSVFAKHVLSCGERIRPASDVAILNTAGKVIAVGKAILSAKMMRVFKVGTAVKVRESWQNQGIGEANA
jgi:uncharacterized protein with predicted RNA binding PUA domain